MPKVIITSESLSMVLGMINTWEGRLTWVLLCEKVASQLGIEGGVTRQSLSSYKAIQEAYSTRKKQLRIETNETRTSKITPNSDITFLNNQISALSAEVEKLNELNNLYKERFVRWLHNAYIHGIRMENLDDVGKMLDKPLLEINRRNGG